MDHCISRLRGRRRGVNCVLGEVVGHFCGCWGVAGSGLARGQPGNAACAVLGKDSPGVTENELKPTKQEAAAGKGAEKHWGGKE